VSGYYNCIISENVEGIRMYNKILIIDREIKEFETLDKIIKNSKIFDGGLEFLLGITNQEELDHASPRVSYEDGCTVIYEESVSESDTEYIHVPMSVKEMRKKLGLSQVAFSKKYEIPRRTLEDWERGINTPPKYVILLLERAVLEDTEK
jgi:putative transcriptional regulator